MTDATPHATARHKAHDTLLALRAKHNAELAELGFVKGLLLQQEREFAAARLCLLETSVAALRSMEEE